MEQLNVSIFVTEFEKSQNFPAEKHQQDWKGCIVNRARDENSRVSTPLDCFILYTSPSSLFLHMSNMKLTKECFD